MIEQITFFSPVMTVACHCHSCQRQTGTSFSVIIAYKKGTLEFTKEHPIFYEHKGDSGKFVRRYFCAKCGSPIMAELEATPELDWLKTGTLDGVAAPWLPPRSAFGVPARSLGCNGRKKSASLPRTLDRTTWDAGPVRPLSTYRPGWRLVSYKLPYLPRANSGASADQKC
ncbi:GFA family protein [Lysobacter gummosus]|uniref:GFA family protein n=1 Tax=Lysobacter gummosus TaxID=262324 RepID=UPI003633B792